MEGGLIPLYFFVLSLLLSLPASSLEVSCLHVFLLSLFQGYSASASHRPITRYLSLPTIGEKRAADRLCAALCHQHHSELACTRM